ncbi:hypothetical protein [Nocardia otitidiscaviarum]|uniref:hypothetical protein n=1 Tax=Nocardia otitidiscaviarum TaxID=1823 RepID=UPI0004A71CED|nr:hypothetical protein [Nocardia otitidiscaviarum]
MPPKFYCVSHACLLWGEITDHVSEARPLTPAELVDLARAHALIHHNRPVRPVDLFGDQERE